MFRPPQYVYLGLPIYVNHSHNLLTYRTNLPLITNWFAHPVFP